jgi:inner membrane protein
MFEILAILFVLGLILLIGLGVLFLVKKLFGSSVLTLNRSDGFVVEKTESDGAIGDTLYAKLLLKLPTLFKVLGISILAVVCLSLLGLLDGVSNERGNLFKKVTQEIGDTWGNSQVVSGPLLVIPYTYQVFDISKVALENGEQKINRIPRLIKDKMIILPKKLNLDVYLDYDFRYRGIYQAMVYNAKLSGNAVFENIQFNKPSLTEIHFEESYLSFGVSDNKAIQKVNTFNANQKNLELNSGTSLSHQGITAGFHAELLLQKQQKVLQVDFDLDFRGSKSISLLPLAEDTQFKVSSNWQHPSFHGMLPNERELSKQGFSAQWELSHLTRNYPQRFSSSNNISLNEVAAETLLFEPITHYSKVKRSIKYGILFICLTFLALLVFDLKKSANFNFIQYCLVGVSLSLFYLLLLSLSEHIGFLAAYLCAALTAVISISIYVGVASSSIKSSILMATLLLALYSVMYSILQLEQFALLTGTIFLLLITLTLMFATRNLAKPTIKTD